MGRLPKDLGEVLISSIGTVWGGFILAWILMGFFGLFCFSIASCLIGDLGFSMDGFNVFLLLFFAPVYMVIGAFAYLGCFGGVWASLFFLCIIQFGRLEDKRTPWGYLLFCLIIIDVFIMGFEIFTVLDMILYFLFTIAGMVVFWGGLNLCYKKRLAALNAQADEMARQRLERQPYSENE